MFMVGAVGPSTWALWDFHSDVEDSLSDNYLDVLG